MSHPTYESCHFYVQLTWYVFYYILNMLIKDRKGRYSRPLVYVQMSTYRSQKKKVRTVIRDEDPFECPSFVVVRPKPRRRRTYISDSVFGGRVRLSGLELDGLKTKTTSTLPPIPYPAPHPVPCTSSPSRGGPVETYP